VQALADIMGLVFFGLVAYYIHLTGMTGMAGLTDNKKMT
jgi:hypothetical protein